MARIGVYDLDWHYGFYKKKIFNLDLMKVLVLSSDLKETYSDTTRWQMIIKSFGSLGTVFFSILIYEALFVNAGNGYNTFRGKVSRRKARQARKRYKTRTLLHTSYR